MFISYTETFAMFLIGKHDGVYGSFARTNLPRTFSVVRNKIRLIMFI